MLNHYRQSEKLMMVTGIDRCGYEVGLAMGWGDEKWTLCCWMEGSL